MFQCSFGAPPFRVGLYIHYDPTINGGPPEPLKNRQDRHREDANGGRGDLDFRFCNDFEIAALRCPTCRWVISARNDMQTNSFNKLLQVVSVLAPIARIRRAIGV